MLFDCDPQLIRTLSKEQKVGKRDIVIKPKSLGANDVTYVGAKSMRGNDFVKKLEEKLTKIVLDYEDEEEDEDDEELDEEDEDEEVDSDEGDSDEEDLEEEDEDDEDLAED